MKKVKTQIDYVADIMQIWYDVMEIERVQVQPKCATMLGKILSEYTITPKHFVRDIWAESMTIKGGDFPKWYSSLDAPEKLQYEEGRQKASDKYDPRERSLLKG
jgi:hypothetical protein